MIYLLLTTTLILAIYAPQLWVQYIMRRYSKESKDIKGTGGELAQHLITRFQLDGVLLEETKDAGDHYDPQNKAVRLSPSNFNGRSLCAIAIAAHEVGHAIQFHRAEPVSQLRLRYIPKAMMLKKFGMTVIMALPVIALLIRVPYATFFVAGLAVLALLVSALMYLIILPEELDASFNKALPILKKGQYITSEQESAVRSILRAAALTYFAAALAEILSIWRWIGALKGMR